MIYVFFANGFEEVEALAPVDILRRAEHEVQMVGVGGKFIKGAHGITVACDIEAPQVSLANMEMAVLPGGMPGTLNLEKSEIVQIVAEYAIEKNIPLGAICAAPSILGHAGLLEGRKATCFPGFEQELTGAEVTGAPVEVDGKLI
ncbi:MAG: DJ-1/PfpI family protein, partial [Oscillospiraceae bacterium]|nr:DJ-1/PfpI family protein [Oscillospiraceae bacterium]